MKKRTLIAETDEHGAVACVWVADPETRGPRIFDPRLHSDKIQSAETAGASRQQITSWVASRKAREDGASATQ